MRIVVLNGSPKGVHSITLQYVRFLEKKYPQHAFQVFNVAHDIRKIEVDEALFREIIQGIEADGICGPSPSITFSFLPNTKNLSSSSGKEKLKILSRQIYRCDFHLHSPFRTYGPQLHPWDM